MRMRSKMSSCIAYEPAPDLIVVVFFLVVRMRGGKGAGEGKIRLFLFRLPECWQSQSNFSIQSN